MTQHRERMLHDGALLCIKGIIKGDMSTFRLISDKMVNGTFFSPMFPIYTQNLVAMETGIYRTFSPKVGHVKIYDLWI